MTRAQIKSLSPGQRVMLDDGCPLPCLLRSEPHDLRPQTTFLANVTRTRDESPETVAFRAQVEEERLAKARAKIMRMKQRFETKAIDFNKFRWDSRRNKFVPIEPGTTRSAPVVKAPRQDSAVAARGEITPAGAVTKANAEAIARLNGIWKDSYEKLRGTGRIVMTVSNVLKGIVKRGGTVKWN